MKPSRAVNRALQLLVDITCPFLIRWNFNNSQWIMHKGSRIPFWGTCVWKTVFLKVLIILSVYDFQTSTLKASKESATVLLIAVLAILTSCVTDVLIAQFGNDLVISCNWCYLNEVKYLTNYKIAGFAYDTIMGCIAFALTTWITFLPAAPITYLMATATFYSHTLSGSTIALKALKILYYIYGIYIGQVVTTSLRTGALLVTHNLYYRYVLMTQMYSNISQSRKIKLYNELKIISAVLNEFEVIATTVMLGAIFICLVLTAGSIYFGLVLNDITICFAPLFCTCFALAILKLTFLAGCSYYNTSLALTQSRTLLYKKGNQKLKANINTSWNGWNY